MRFNEVSQDIFITVCNPYTWMAGSVGLLGMLVGESWARRRNPENKSAIKRSGYVGALAGALVGVAGAHLVLNI